MDSSTFNHKNGQYQKSKQTKSMPCMIKIDWLGNLWGNKNAQLVHGFIFSKFCPLWLSTASTGVGKLTFLKWGPFPVLEVDIDPGLEDSRWPGLSPPLEWGLPVVRVEGTGADVTFFGLEGALIESKGCYSNKQYSLPTSYYTRMPCITQAIVVKDLHTTSISTMQND